MTLLQKLAWFAAVFFILLGVLGFVPGATNDDGMLFGIFHVDMMHNIVHIFTGIVAAFAAANSATYSRWFFLVIGVVYALVAIIGFVQGDTVLGLMEINMADNWLHVAITVVSLGIGLGVKEGSTMVSSM